MIHNYYLKEVSSLITFLFLRFDDDDDAVGEQLATALGVLNVDLFETALYKNQNFFLFVLFIYYYFWL
jgi:hypothetical protein